MKKRYTKRQIEESIKYWKKQLNEDVDQENLPEWMQSYLAENGGHVSIHRFDANDIYSPQIKHVSMEDAAKKNFNAYSVYGMILKGDDKYLFEAEQNGRFGDAELACSNIKEEFIRASSRHDDEVDDIRILQVVPVHSNYMGFQ